MSVQSLTSIRQSITQSSTKRLFTWPSVNRQSAMYESATLLAFAKSSLDRSTWSAVLYVTLQFILRISRLVQQHVNERARNKSITRGRSGEYYTSKSRSLLMQEMSTRSLHHLLRDFQSESHLTVDDLHRMFLGKSRPIGLQQHQLRPFSSRNSGKCSLESSCTPGPIQIRITSYLNATASPAFEMAKFEIFRPTHARGNLPRQFSILVHFFSRFSEASPTLSSPWASSRAFCHLLDWQLGQIKCLESWERMEISALGEYWPEGATKVICFRTQEF